MLLLFGLSVLCVLASQVRVRMSGHFEANREFIIESNFDKPVRMLDAIKANIKAIHSSQYDYECSWLDWKRGRFEVQQYLHVYNKKGSLIMTAHCTEDKTVKVDIKQFNEVDIDQIVEDFDASYQVQVWTRQKTEWLTAHQWITLIDPVPEDSDLLTPIPDYEGGEEHEPRLLRMKMAMFERKAHLKELVQQCKSYNIKTPNIDGLSGKEAHRLYFKLTNRLLKAQKEAINRLNCQLAEEKNKVETATSDKEVIELELVELKSISQDRVLKLEADLMEISQEFAMERERFAVDLQVKTAELAEEQEKAKDLQQQLEKCEFELSTAIKDLQQRVFELNYMVNQSGNELHDLREAAKIKENQSSQTIKMLTSKNAELNKELEAVSRELSLNVEANTVMGKTIAKLGFYLKEAEKTIKTLTEQLAQAKTDHEGKVQELETKTNKKKEKLTKVKEDVKKLEEQNSELVQETTTLKTSVASMESENMELRETLSSAESDISQKSRMLSVLETGLDFDSLEEFQTKLSKPAGYSPGFDLKLNESLSVMCPSEKYYSLPDFKTVLTEDLPKKDLEKLYIYYRTVYLAEGNRLESWTALVLGTTSHGIFDPKIDRACFLTPDNPLPELSAIHSQLAEMQTTIKQMEDHAKRILASIHQRLVAQDVDEDSDVAQFLLDCNKKPASANINPVLAHDLLESIKQFSIDRSIDLHTYQFTLPEGLQSRSVDDEADFEEEQ